MKKGKRRTGAGLRKLGKELNKKHLTLRVFYRQIEICFKLKVSVNSTTHVPEKKKSVRVGLPFSALRVRTAIRIL